MEEPKRRSGRQRRRPSRRSESHDAAHALAHTPSKIPDHPLVPQDPPDVITSNDALDELVEAVRAAGVFAYDTEFIGEETYHPRIALIQIATRERVSLIDLMADVDPTPVWELVADAEVQTVVHAGEQDLEPVVRHLDRAPANVFDTQVAAAFTGRPYPLALDPLVGQFVDVSLSKSMTFTRWDARPLSAHLANYAADDVRYLLAVQAGLEADLADRGTAGWAAEELATLTRRDRYRFDPDARATRLAGPRGLPPRAMATLRELVILRERAAEAQDVPPRTFLVDNILVRLARDPVKSVERLQDVRGLPAPVIRKYGQEIIDATARGREAPLSRESRPRPPSEGPAERTCIAGLLSLTASYCYGRGVDPGLVTNRPEIAQLFFARFRGVGEPPARLATGWRHELLGDWIERVIAGEVVEFRFVDECLRTVDGHS